MNHPSSRICTKTGLALTAGPVSALRVARESYGPLNPPPRSRDTDVSGWSRYDTTGRTIYACADPATAYMELIAPYRTDVNQQRRALQPLADALGVDLDSLWEQVVDEWDTAGTMKASWLPRSFREGRNLYTLEFPTGWWIDATAMATIAALNSISQAWPSTDGPIENLTVSHLTGDDRVLTTSIATYLRENIQLDDGTLPLGIEFLSKHGRPHGSSGTCWAQWLRNTDSGLDELTKITSRKAINLDDPDLKSVLAYCKIKAR